MPRLKHIKYPTCDYEARAIERWFERKEGSRGSKVKSYAPEGHTLVAIEDHILDRLTQSARERGVSVETLVNLWLQEKLTA